MQNHLLSRPPIGPLFVLLVPTTDATGIASGSAIVAERDSMEAMTDRVMVHYEGNLYGSKR